MGKLCLLISKHGDDTITRVVQNKNFPVESLDGIKLRIDLSPRQINRAKSDCLIPGDNIGPLLDARKKIRRNLHGGGRQVHGL